MGLATIMKLPRRIGRYAWHTWKYARAAARKHNISTFHIVREQVALKRANGLSADEYYFYGFDNPAIPWEEKLTYLGGARTRQLWTVFTPERYQHYYKNKLVFKHFFQSMGFPIAKLLAVYDPVCGKTVAGKPFCTAEDVAAWMAETDVQDVVFKPMESAEGRMVLVMKGRKAGDATKFVHTSGKEYSPECLVEFMTDPDRLREAYPFPEYAVPLNTMLVEQRLHQHPDLNVFAPNTLCCARLVTVTTLDGRVEVVESCIKLQDSDSGIDNQIQGSVGIHVDLETGVLGTGRLEFDPGHVRRTFLLNSKKEFIGFQLPMWDKAVQLAKSAALAFPHAHTVGWDIAFTDDGPYIIEGNAAWGNFQIECQEGLWQGAYRETAEKLIAQQEGR